MRKRLSAVVLASALTLAGATAPAFADEGPPAPPVTLVTCRVAVNGQVVATVRVAPQAANQINGLTITVNGRTITVTCP
jgi:hypothetical protein